eukprot:227953_1
MAHPNASDEETNEQRRHLFKKGNRWGKINAQKKKNMKKAGHWPHFIKRYTRKGLTFETYKKYYDKVMKKKMQKKSKTNVMNVMKRTLKAEIQLLSKRQIIQRMSRRMDQSDTLPGFYQVSGTKKQSLFMNKSINYLILFGIF